MAGYTEEKLKCKKTRSCYSLNWPIDLIKKYPDKFNFYQLLSRAVQKKDYRLNKDFLREIYIPSNRGQHLAETLATCLITNKWDHFREFLKYQDITLKYLSDLILEFRYTAPFDLASYVIYFSGAADTDFVKKEIFSENYNARLDGYYVFMCIKFSETELNEIYQINPSVMDWKSIAMYRDFSEKFFWEHVKDINLDELLLNKLIDFDNWSEEFQLFRKLKS